MLMPSVRVIALVMLVAGALVAGSCADGERQPPAGPSTLAIVESPSGAPVAVVVDDPPAEDPPLNGDEPAPEPPPPTEPPPTEPPPPAPEPTPTPDPVPAPPPVNSPWNPGPPPRAEAGVPVPTPPSWSDRVLVKIDPEPVPYSGNPIPDIASCRILPHTWFYEQIVHNQTGITITFNERENFFDGRFSSKVSQTLELKPNGTFRLFSKWCSGYRIFHYAQTRFRGKDENNNPIEISGPWVRLNP
jgi:hypothetical protein